jgi:hypothetical protein
VWCSHGKVVHIYFYGLYDVVPRRAGLGYSQGDVGVFSKLPHDSQTKHQAIALGKGMVGSGWQHGANAPLMRNH